MTCTYDIICTKCLGIPVSVYSSMLDLGSGLVVDPPVQCSRFGGCGHGPAKDRTCETTVPALLFGATVCRFENMWLRTRTGAWIQRCERPGRPHLDVGDVRQVLGPVQMSASVTWGSLCESGWPYMDCCCQGDGVSFDYHALSQWRGVGMDTDCSGPVRPPCCVQKAFTHA